MSESFHENFEKEICRLADRHPSLVLVRPADEGCGLFTGSFRNRLFQVDTLSTHAIALAGGLASIGKIVVVAAERMDFAGRFANDIQHVLAATPKNVTMVSLPPKHADPAEWHSENWGLLRMAPGVEVFAPADFEELRQVLEYGVSRHTPTFIRCPGVSAEGQWPEVFHGSCHFSPGVWPRLRDGGDLAFITCGRLATAALLAAQKLASEGIQSTLLHAGSIQPVDRRALSAVAKKIRRVVTCEEHISAGGLGGAVAETLSEWGLPVKLVRLGFSGRHPLVPITPEMIHHAARNLFKPDPKRSRS